MGFFGRQKILTDVDIITKENVVDVLRNALAVHMKNRSDIEFLYNYYRGDQPIWRRVKDVRPEIINKVMENRANEIVSFKVGYLMGEPIQYVTRSDSEALANQVSKLNDYVLSEDKAAKDEELAEWMHICGTAYRMVLPDSTADVEMDEAPFEIYTLDPRNTFVVYHNGLGEQPVMGVKYVQLENETVYSVYTKDMYFEITGTDEIRNAEPQYLGIPIIEYPLNTARLGAFEVVLPLLDAINNVDSNRMDGVEQFVQALMLFHNVDIDEEQFSMLRKDGAIKYKDVDPNFKASIEYLTAELNQTQTQTLVDHMYNTVLTICGMPNRNGGKSTSDTGSAVILRDGWSAAEARAKKAELMFKRSEKEFLRKAIRICNDLADLSLKMSAIEVRFTRRNYENITAKADVLTKMLSNDKIHPYLAFQHCGLFTDPNVAYKMSMDYYETKQKEQEKQQEVGNGSTPGAGDGQGG